MLGVASSSRIVIHPTLCIHLGENKRLINLTSTVCHLTLFNINVICQIIASLIPISICLSCPKSSAQSMDLLYSLALYQRALAAFQLCTFSWQRLLNIVCFLDGTYRVTLDSLFPLWYFIIPVGKIYVSPYWNIFCTNIHWLFCSLASIESWVIQLNQIHLDASACLYLLISSVQWQVWDLSDLPSQLI